MARTAPATYTIITPTPHMPFQPIVAGPSPTLESLAMMAKNINHCHRYAHKVYCIQPCQKVGEENYITASSSAVEGAPDKLYYWYLDHLVSEQGIRVLARYKTDTGGDGGSVGIRIDLIEPDGTVNGLYSDVVDSSGSWADFDETLDPSAVADYTDPHILRFSIFENDSGATISLKNIIVLTAAPATLSAGIQSSGFAPLDTDSWDANSALCTAQMQFAQDNLEAIVDDHNSSFLCWSELLIGARADDLIRAEVGTYLQRSIPAVPVRYMPGVTTIKWAICWYNADASDELRVYSGHEKVETGLGNITGVTTAVVAGTVDPGLHAHWATGSCKVKEHFGSMGEDYIIVERLTDTTRGSGIVGITIWE